MNASDCTARFAVLVFIALAPAGLAPQTCAPPPAGIVSWWPGNENANDVAYGNDGTLQNGATFAPGLVGQAFSFDGTNQFVEIPDSANLNFAPTSSMTVDLWAFRIGAAHVMHLLGKRSGCDQFNYQLAFNTDSGEGLVFGGSQGGVATGKDLPLNTWTHLAGTFDGTTFRLYMNGGLIGTSTGVLGPETSAPLEIGGSGSCATFDGLLDEVQIFDRALSDAEIQSIFSAGSAGQCSLPPHQKAVFITGVASAAAYQANIAPASWVTIGGTNLANNTRTWRADEIKNGQLPTSLDGTSVTIDGEPAFVYYISPRQLNVQAPSDTNTGAVQVVVTNNGVASDPASANLQPFSPALFLWPGNYVAATHLDFSLAVKNGEFQGLTTVPANPNEVIILWGTGFGNTNPIVPAGQVVAGNQQHTLTSPPTITIGGAVAEYVGGALAPGSASLYQLAVRVPPNLPDGDSPVEVQIGGVSSPYGLLTINNPSNTACLTASATPASQQTRARLGMYYFDGWAGPLTEFHFNGLLNGPFQGRQPLSGWQDNNRCAVEQQLAWAHSFGINFFVFDWYFNATIIDTTEDLNSALKIMHTLPNRHGMQYAIVYVDDGPFTVSPADWHLAVSEWVGYFTDPAYVRLNGKPLFIVINVNAMRQAFGSSATVAAAFSQLRAAGQAKGLPGVYIAGGFTAGYDPVSQGGSFPDLSMTVADGYDAVTMYNYSTGLSGLQPFSILSETGQWIWNQGVLKSPLPFIPVAMDGWDARPWNEGNVWYSRSPQDVTGFVNAAILWAGSNPQLRPEPPPAPPLVLVEAWNELAEGSYLVPTVGDGTSYGDALAAMLTAQPHNAVTTSGTGASASRRSPR